MKGHWEYFKYIVRHKWLVYKAGVQFGLPRWQALIHDWHKFLPREFFPYSRSFYAPDGTSQGIADKSDGFDAAWMLHQRAKHHWQAWVMIDDGGKLKPQPVPALYLMEMVADWVAMGAARNKCNPKAWYYENIHKFVLHGASKGLLESLLDQWEHDYGDAWMG